MRIDWDLDSERLYEVGSDRGVVYPFNEDTKVYETGYAWNGLTGVDESPSGGEANSVYANNGKYLNNRSDVEFSGTINAYTYPEEFELCDGTAVFGNTGVKVHQQKRKKFAFSYRSRIGNDIEGEDYGYKIHLFYNCMASPSSKSMETVNNDPNAATFSWELSTTPIEIDGAKRSAHIIIDSRSVFPASIKMLEDMLYGTDDTEPRMPTIDELRDLYPQITLSGPFVSFIDGAPDQPVVSLKADINPDQDLHGFDNPWVGGTGKNQLDFDNATLTKGTVSGTADSFIFTVTGSGASGVFFSLPDSFAGKTMYLSGRIERTGTHENNIAVQLQRDIDGTTGYIAEVSYTDNAVTLEDKPISFPENGTNFVLRIIASGTSDDSTGETMTVTNLQLCDETGQAWSPYENICPIENVSVVNVTRLGKNLVESNGYDRNISHGVTFTKNSDGSYTANGTNNMSQGPGVVNACWSKIAVFDDLPAGDYYFTGGVLPADKANVYIWDLTANAAAKKWDGVTDAGANSSGNLAQFKVVEGHQYSMRFRIRFDQTAENLKAYPMVCQAFETDPTYEKYNNTVYTIQLGDAVYGGELDAVTGILTATMKYMELTGAEGYSMSSGSTHIISMQRSAYGNAKSSGRIVSDRFKRVFSSTGVKFGGILISSASNGIIQFTNSDLYFATAEDFQTWIASEYAAETPVQICYELAEPITIQLTPQQITTLLGRNTFWADTGDIELTYRATDIHD